MKIIPILFSGPMVRANFEGRKTVTRRLVKFPAECGGEPGDLLWVRENFCVYRGGMTEDGEEWDRVDGPLDEYNPIDGVYGGMASIQYAADGKCFPLHWRPSIHLPRWACRLVLRRVGPVRIERAHQITKAEVLAEGVDPIAIEANEKFFHRDDAAPLAFGAVLDRAYGTGTWKSNPWLWVIPYELAAKTHADAQKLLGSAS